MFLMTFVITIDPSLAEKVRSDLMDQGFVFSQPLHTLFSAHKQGVSCTFYASGKFVVQGKNVQDFLEFYLEPEILQRFDLTSPVIARDRVIDIRDRIGVDEAGKGDFFGALCIAAVHAGGKTVETLISIGVKDSKQLSDPSVRRIAVKIKQYCPHSVVTISPQKYNELYSSFQNLNRLLAWGHATAIQQLYTKTLCQEVIIDQFERTNLVKKAIQEKNLPINLTQRTGAEEDPVVAAASILARASFLESMDALSKESGFVLPKGASAQVLGMARTIIERAGISTLDGLCKRHFKTYQQAQLL